MCEEIIAENFPNMGKEIVTQVQDVQSPIQQQSPTFLAPWTGFMEDNFSTGGGVGDGMVQVLM